jgi:hypothetical protein
MGRKLRGHLERARFTVESERSIEDPELSFDGPATPEVVGFWSARLDRMTLLHEHCGAEFGRVQEDFLSCLGRSDHRSIARVVFCLAFKPKA